ncbi:MAG: hypothetical protein RL030_147, partial [Pseudomonadota bacterium]
RDSGETLTPYLHKGEYWVAGRPGARYAISIRSQTGTRLLAVTSVDGINVLSGQGAAANQGGYVFDPWVGNEIDGWRKSDSEIAAFTFTAVPNAYAALTGRPKNIGVIGVALFRERQPDPPPVSMEWNESDRRYAPAAPARESLAAGSLGSSDSASRNEAAADRSAAKSAAAPSVAQSLGTGHGAREYSQVVSVPFERAQSQPDETIRIRYDSRENLIALGVIRVPKPRYTPNPFPGDSRVSYVPDP